MSLGIRPAGPFHLGHSLVFLRGFGPTRGEQHVDDTQLTKALLVGDRPVVFRARQRGGLETPTIDVELFSDRPLDAAERRQALEGIEAMLSTGENLGPFYARASQDPVVAPLARRYRGLHHVRFPSAFEAACWGLLNQRIGMAAARKMKDALTRRAGRSLLVDGVEHWAFPDPAAVLALGERELGRLLPGGRRAAAVAAAARAFAAVDACFLREAPIDEVRAWLGSIHGVGTFTSGFVLFRGLGRFDGALPALSRRFVAAASALYRRRLATTELAKLSAEYGSWGGHWMLYLWASTFV